MKKLTIGFLLLTSYSSFSFAQKWDSLAGGLNGPLQFPGVEALCAYNGNLYAGGFINLSSSSCIASWNGNIWLPLGNGLRGNYYPCGLCCSFTPNVEALIQYNGNIFAGGYFDTITGEYANAVAQWNGSLWDSVGVGVDGASHSSINCIDVTSFAIYQGNLYIGGAFQYTGNNMRVNYIAKWNGVSWYPVGVGMNGGINCLTVYNGNLYAGGGFDSAGGIPAKNIAMWNGAQWSAVGSGINGSVIALSPYNGTLFAGGEFDSAGGHLANNIAFWNSTTWNAVGAGINGGYINALTTYGSVLCVGGNFDSAGGLPANNITYWNGSSWGTLGSGVNGLVNVLTTYNGALIVGGVFDTAGGIAANNIAQWSSPLGIHAIKANIGNAYIFPNPSSGIFTIALVGAQNPGAATIEIYNVMGEKVYSQLTMDNGQLTINLSDKPNGLYFYRVLQENGTLLGEGKMIIQK